MEEVKGAINNPFNSDWLENQIISQHSWKSFQQSKKIEEALALVSDKKLWEEISRLLNVDSEELKKRLNLIVDRRNKIAHEADIAPSSPGVVERWPIDEIMVEDILTFIQNIVTTIHKIIV